MSLHVLTSLYLYDSNDETRETLAMKKINVKNKVFALVLAFGSGASSVAVTVVDRILLLVNYYFAFSKRLYENFI